MSDHIILKGMVFYGYHGVTPPEKMMGQPFVVDLEMEANLRISGSSDDIKDTVDYSQVYQAVKEVVEGPSRDLLESVAEGVAQKLLQAFPLDGVRVRVTKPHVPIKGAVVEGAGVEIHRRRVGQPLLENGPGGTKSPQSSPPIP
ncbi:MAG: dihydroneopterin aldolase [Chloroflexi bacterium]|nr:dihydroneopterin aldolase [Chloroflexota bacterium]